MSKVIRNAKKKFSHMERGQVLVVVAGAAIGIIAVIGLVMDVGLMFIGNARLRRAVDAAALSSALQFREGYNIDSLTNAANEFLMLDGFSNPDSHVYTCDDNPQTDMNCIVTQSRKLVEVHATAQIPLAFLPVIGINSITISATAISETASLDVVLAIDTSESMTYTAGSGTPMRDPSYCNGISGTDSHGRLHASTCEPFFDVISAAVDFTDILFFPYDQMSIVTFNKDAGIPDPVHGTLVPNLEFSQDCPSGPSGCTPATQVIPTLLGLQVFEGAGPYKSASSDTEDYRCYGPQSGQCSGSLNLACNEDAHYDTTANTTNYQGLIGKKQDPCLGYTAPFDPSHYTTTNIGAGLEMAGNELASDNRQDVLWVVILLTDGVPNAGYSDDSTPIYYCPNSTTPNTWSMMPAFPNCENADAANDWNNGVTTGTSRTRPVATDPSYDALAYAFDEADYVGLPFDSHTNTGGQGALIYTIGLGSELTNYKLSTFTYSGNYLPTTTVNNVGLGTVFLNYAAGVGKGLYYPAPSASQLNTIFREIGTNIAVRLAK